MLVILIRLSFVKRNSSLSPITVELCIQTIAKKKYCKSCTKKVKCLILILEIRHHNKHFNNFNNNSIKAILKLMWCKSIILKVLVRNRFALKRTWSCRAKNFAMLKLCFQIVSFSNLCTNELIAVCKFKLNDKHFLSICWVKCILIIKSIHNWKLSHKRNNKYICVFSVLYIILHVLIYLITLFVKMFNVYFVVAV